MIRALKTPYDIEEKTLRRRTRQAMSGIVMKLMDCMQIGDVDLWEEVDGKLFDVLQTYRERGNVSLALAPPSELLRSLDGDQIKAASLSAALETFADELSGMASSY